MAQVAHEQELSRRVDWDLERLLGFWRTVPEQAAEWMEWDEDSKLDMIIEWPIDRERLRRVVHAAEAGQLNVEQCRSWQEVQQLIARHRTTVEEMLGQPI